MNLSANSMHSWKSVDYRTGAISLSAKAEREKVIAKIDVKMYFSKWNQQNKYQKGIK